MLFRYIEWFDLFLFFRVFAMQVEFAVQMTCESCADKVRTVLQGKPGKKYWNLSHICLNVIFSPPVFSIFY